MPRMIFNNPLCKALSATLLGLLSTLFVAGSATAAVKCTADAGDLSFGSIIPWQGERASTAALR
ncbi:hypothetical protein [Diaphorobacter aerolatus]|uniref:Uncharacterized protein n=1 Tax=Diaphorobacter aerolatus TaxID=1288495 RepID=A0A7H0GP47_9BURK|nr:hypothetical protein [Diaphorobacter aerolatus]QNP50063.1 hypothetical protein H9K75_09600 [Diaphorobacter aerolatus]